MEVTVCRLVNAAASQGQEKSHLLFPNDWKSEEHLLEALLTTLPSDGKAQQTFDLGTFLYYTF